MFLEKWTAQNSCRSNFETTNLKRFSFCCWGSIWLPRSVKSSSGSVCEPTDCLSFPVPVCWCPSTTGSARTSSRWVTTRRGDAAARDLKRTSATLQQCTPDCKTKCFISCFTGVGVQFCPKQVTQLCFQPQRCFFVFFYFRSIKGILQFLHQSLSKKTNVLVSESNL